MEPIYILSAGLEIFCAVIAAIILVGCLLESRQKRITGWVFVLMLVIDIVMNLVDAYIWVGADTKEYQLLMRILSFASYTLGGIIFALFSFFLIAYIKELTKVPKWVYAGFILGSLATISTWMFSIFNNMYYYWDENGVCHNGELFWLSQLYGLFFLIGNLLLIAYYHKYLRKREQVVFVLYNIFPLLSFVVTFLCGWEATPLYVAMTISMLLYYTVIHLEHGKRVADQETKLVRQELELVNSHTAIMLSQIQPHFLFNSLTAIAQLCEKSPKKAKETILSFSEYLRQNMSSLDQKYPIPFSQALEHMKEYLSIEQIRFGDLIHVEYDVEVTDFLIPALCLQPMVENAVKHGIRMRESGGTVKVSTREEEKGYLIVVADDGVGFDMDTVMNDGKQHIGIKNVRERLEVLVHGTMEIESEIGVGTIVKMMIPIGEER